MRHTGYTTLMTPDGLNTVTIYNPNENGVSRLNLKYLTAKWKCMQITRWLHAPSRILGGRFVFQNQIT